MRRMLVAVSWLCIAAWLLARIHVPPNDPNESNGVIILLGCALGAAIGTLATRSATFIFGAVICGAIVGFGVSIMYISYWTSELSP